MNAFLTLVALAAAQAPPARAALHETLFHPGAPDASLVELWSRHPEPRGYRLELGFPSSHDLTTIAALRRFDRLEILVSAFPDDASIAAWRRLASAGARLVALDAGFPSDDEIDRLNAIGFESVTLVTTAFPGVEEGRRLARLRPGLSITFATRMYPRFADREAFEAIPRQARLLFVTDYWPWYTHMDLLNLLPHRVRLRVRDVFPSEDHFPYLLNIRRLEEAAVETDYDAPEPGVWGRFGALPVRWISRGRVPSAEGLGAFAASGRTRSLTLDLEGDLASEDLGRLRRLELPVEWIHSPWR